MLSIGGSKAPSRMSHDDIKQVLSANNVAWRATVPPFLHCRIGNSPFGIATIEGGLAQFY